MFIPSCKVLEQLCIALFLQLACILSACGLLHRLLRTSERVRSHIRSRSVGIRGQNGSSWVLCLDNSESCVLVKVRPEMEAAMHAALVACADEGATLNDVVQTVETRRGEVFVVRVHLEAGQGAEVVAGPLPGIAEHIVETLWRNKNKHWIILKLVN